jgi:hypothetical protein
MAEYHSSGRGLPSKVPRNALAKATASVLVLFMWLAAVPSILSI